MFARWRDARRIWLPMATNSVSAFGQFLLHFDNSHAKTACEITPVASTSIEAGHVIKSGPGVLASATINNWGTDAGVTVFVLDATSIPSNGTLPGCDYASASKHSASLKRHPETNLRRCC